MAHQVRVMLVLAAVLAACREPDEAPLRQAAVALEEEARDTPLVVSVVLAGTQGGLNVFRRSSDELEMLVTNHWSEDGEVKLTADSRSEAGRTSVELARLSLDAGSSQSVTVDASSLELPTGSFEYSGSLVIRADLVRPGGDVSRSDPLTLSFHPAETGWYLYDAANREGEWSGGALTAESRSRREVVFARLGEQGRLRWMGRATSRKVSDSTDWKPEPDGPPDQE